MPQFDQNSRVEGGFELFAGRRNRVGISHLAHLESKDKIIPSAHAQVGDHHTLSFLTRYIALSNEGNIVSTKLVVNH